VIRRRVAGALVAVVVGVVSGVTTNCSPCLSVRRGIAERRVQESARTESGYGILYRGHLCLNFVLAGSMGECGCRGVESLRAGMEPWQQWAAPPSRVAGGGGEDALGVVHLGCVAAIKTRDTPSRWFDPGRWLRIVRSVLNRAYVRFGP
jgi:hypothetical protein